MYRRGRCSDSAVSCLLRKRLGDAGASPWPPRRRACGCEGPTRSILVCEGHPRTLASPPACCPHPRRAASSAPAWCEWPPGSRSGHRSKLVRWWPDASACPPAATVAKSHVSQSTLLPSPSRVRWASPSAGGQGCGLWRATRWTRQVSRWARSLAALGSHRESSGSGPVRSDCPLTLVLTSPCPEPSCVPGPSLHRPSPVARTQAAVSSRRAAARWGYQLYSWGELRSWAGCAWDFACKRSS